MSGTRHGDHHPVPQEPDQPGDGRPRVKFTDRRRVHADADDREAVDASRGSPASGGGGRSGASAGSSEAGPADELEEARRKAAEYLDHLQRLKAEFDNFRKRELKERTRAIEMASEPLIRRLLEVVDEFDLALMAAEKQPDFDKVLHGVELVYAKLMDILRAEGVERIDAMGKPFDPTLHEALMQGGDGEGDPVVSDILRQGYTMKGRVVRPAGVKVSRR
jgi:molecular chaperone GrpE